MSLAQHADSGQKCLFLSFDPVSYLKFCFVAAQPKNLKWTELASTSEPCGKAMRFSC